MSVQAHCDKLAEGLEAWNDWRTTSPDTKIDLSGATISLQGQELCKFDFRGVDFSRAVFSDVVLRQANFTNALLRGTEFQAEVILEDCDFQDAIFEGTTFEFCHLTKCRFDRSDRGLITGLSFLKTHCEKVTFSGTFLAVSFNKSELHGVDFTEVVFRDCSFSEATAIQCIFADTKLKDVTFEGARLIGSDFRRARFKSTTKKAQTGKDLFAADLTGADLRGAEGYQFDNNRTHGLILSPYASDDWSKLRRAYTGTKFSFNVLFLLLFFLPIIAKAVFWMQVARFEHSIEQVESSLVPVHKP